MDALAGSGADVLFYLFAALAVVGAVLVVTLRNPMYGAIALLVSFLAVAALFVLRHAEFLAVVQVFVYGGGIMVLFLFVIMLVNLHRLRETHLFWGQSPLALVLVALLVIVCVGVLATVRFGTPFLQPQAFTAVEGEAMGNSQAVAWQLYRDYLLPFEIASIFLLVAMIGAVVLGRRE
jgi:NADH-quinone oxidoreductase subunit J